MRPRWAATALAALATFASAGLERAACAAQDAFLARAEVIEWMETYRLRPQPERLPMAIKALSRFGALREPENAGFPTGFVAGVLGSNRARAEALVARMLPLPAADQWIVVRGIAYSGLPSWQSLLARIAPQLSARRVMIDEYLVGRLPVLQAIERDADPTFLETLRMQLASQPKSPRVSFGSNPELIDTLWGAYFASGSYWPIWRLMTLLPWSKERDSLARLSAGSAAKVTLANNAARYPDLLALIREMAPYQDEEVRPILAEVIHAAETAQAAQLRKTQVALIEELKSKGPGYRRDMKLWGHVGQGAIALGCIAAASVSLTALGLPCVIGGALSSAAINSMAASP